MAYTKSSNLVTNSDATPIVMNDVGVLGGRVRIAQDAFLAGVLADTNTVALCRLPAEARIHSIVVWNDDLGTAVPADLGIYTTAGVAKDSNKFATAYALGTASTGAGTELRFEAVVTEIDALTAKLYTLAGDTIASHASSYDIAFTVNGTVSAAVTGHIAFKVLYTID